MSKKLLWLLVLAAGIINLTISTQSGPSQIKQTKTIPRIVAVEEEVLTEDLWKYIQGYNLRLNLSSEPGSKAKLQQPVERSAKYLDTSGIYLEPKLEMGEKAANIMIVRENCSLEIRRMENWLPVEEKLVTNLDECRNIKCHDFLRASRELVIFDCDKTDVFGSTKTKLIFLNKSYAAVNSLEVSEDSMKNCQRRQLLPLSNNLFIRYCLEKNLRDAESSSIEIYQILQNKENVPTISPYFNVTAQSLQMEKLLFSALTTFEDEIFLAESSQNKILRIRIEDYFQMKFAMTKKVEFEDRVNSLAVEKEAFSGNLFLYAAADSFAAQIDWTQRENNPLQSIKYFTFSSKYIISQA